MTVHLLYGDHPFQLETRALVRLKHLEAVEKVAVSDSLSNSSYSFPILNEYCYKHEIDFGRNVSPKRFSVEGEGIYITKYSNETSKIASDFRDRGFEVIPERVI